MDGERQSFLGRLLAGWKRFARLLAWLTAPVRTALGFLVMSLIYLLIIPFWSVFMIWRDPLRRRLEPDRASYFEPQEPAEPTLEKLSHGS